MGYELLDSHGGSAPLPAGQRQPSDVVALDDLPPADAQQASPPPRWLRRLRPGRSDRGDGGRRRLPRTTWLAAAVTCVLGVAAGAWWGGTHAEIVQRAKARSQVTVVASPMNVSPIQTGSGPAADVTVRIDNVSDLPADVVISHSGEQATARHPLVHLVTGDAHVPAHGQALVVARVPLSCDTVQPLTLSVPLRAVDGTQRQVAVREVDESVTSSPYELCEQLRGNSQVVDVSLAGQLAAPVLMLRNNSGAAAVFRLDDQTPAQGLDGPHHPISIVTTPALPVLVGPHGTVLVRLKLHLQSCDGDLSRLSQLQTFLPFHVQDQHGTDLGYAGVDLSPLVGALLVRDCR